ncbi:hypothetical protein FOA43_000238 [Brettanomyces nanus]|uniref:Xylanolytic transcriptional activator regulatory domain-containing protein n=1 Tax=Eeniella nana TaxID=13502 RepID=A0A875S0F2_EENNA|nr:uncharacterized protein FOA43_000238 [Brettanomyces nanus]QPG72934.1 hypothetical protein FOA43_000238 [Brettanomyces nanus]
MRSPQLQPRTQLESRPDPQLPKLPELPVQRQPLHMLQPLLAPLQALQPQPSANSDLPGGKNKAPHISSLPSLQLLVNSSGVAATSLRCVSSLPPFLRRSRSQSQKPDVSSTNTSATNSATNSSANIANMSANDSTNSSSNSTICIYSMQQQQSALRGNPAACRSSVTALATKGLPLPQLSPVPSPSTAAVQRTSSMTASVDSATFSGQANSSSIASSVSSGTTPPIQGNGAQGKALCPFQFTSSTSASTSSAPLVSLAPLTAINNTAIAKVTSSPTPIASAKKNLRTLSNTPSLLYTSIVKSFLEDSGEFSFGRNRSPGYSLADSAASISSQGIISAALDAYFVHTQREYPFLTEKDVRSHARKLDISDNTSNVNAASVEVLMVLAIGCRVLESAGAASKTQQYPHFFFIHARDIMAKGVVLTGLQAARLMTLLCAFFIYGDNTSKCWMVLGSLLRLTVALNLHHARRNKLAVPQSLSHKSSHNKDSSDARSRLFFSIYSLDRTVSATMGRPVGISDDDIDVSLPERAPCESQADIEISRRLIEMARVEGLLIQNIHAVRAVESFRSTDERAAIYTALRGEIEAWYSRCSGYRAQLAAKSSVGLPGAARMPLQNPTAWFNSEYYQLLILFYKPSDLIVHPLPENLEMLAKCAMQGLSFMYSLYTSNWFPNSWTVFYRFISLSRALLYCLCHECIDLLQVKTNLPLAREMLDYFAVTWPYASQLASVLAKVSDSLNDATNLRRLSTEFQQVLDENVVDLWKDDVRHMI